MKRTTAITTVKRNLQLQEWTKQIKAQQEIGIVATAELSDMGCSAPVYVNNSTNININFNNPPGNNNIIDTNQNSIK